MRMRRVIVLGAAALAAGAAGALLLSRPARDAGPEGIVRVVAASPVDAPPPATAGPVLPAPSEPAGPDNRLGPHEDPPAPREAGAPNYAELGVQPPI
jgi:hypothetical protein